MEKFYISIKSQSHNNFRSLALYTANGENIEYMEQEECSFGLVSDLVEEYKQDNDTWFNIDDIDQTQTYYTMKDDAWSFYNNDDVTEYHKEVIELNDCNISMVTEITELDFYDKSIEHGDDWHKAKAIYDQFKSNFDEQTKG